MTALEIHKKKGLQLCLRTLLIRADCTPFIKQFVDGRCGVESPMVKSMDLVQMMREECMEDERYSIDQLKGIVEMLATLWMKEDGQSVLLQYSKVPSIYNALLYFVDQDTLRLKDNTHIVCHWEDILRWHTLSSAIGEDLLVCAFLASYDQKNALDTISRNDFTWPSYIRTDDPTLETMLEMPLADIHAHLKGSSLNFDVNWICLMNHIDGRKEQFEDLTDFIQGTQHNKKDAEGLYQKAVAAAAIRLFLAQQEKTGGVFSMKDLKAVLRCFTDGSILNKANTLQQSIGTALEICGKKYSNEITGETARFDYAIREGITVPRGKQEMCAYSLLSGERYILYNALANIYKGGNNDGQIATLLYVYLLIKNEIRHELSQLNDTVGFANFSIYERRKLIFTESYPVYEKAAIHLAVASFFNENPDGSRYHETRITPKLSDEDMDNVVDKNIAEIDFCDNAIENSMFRSRNETESLHWTYCYIYHFIKENDKIKEELLEVEPRHHLLREKVKKQALGIYDLRNSLKINKRGEYYADRIVGIDAANSEIAARPEVFAQAFRFLRRHQITHKQNYRPADLGITYHVGEDFMDIVDGLRAVDESIRFLQLEKGDRIGHGLVLGVDVEKYYQLRNYTVALSLQMQMDNAAWLWKRLTQMGLYDKCRAELEHRFGICFRRVYPEYGGTPNIDLFYSSMLLRGDNPSCYDSYGKVNNRYNHVTGWGNKALVRSKVCDEARKQREACRLYYLYHYSKDWRLNSKVYDTWEVDDEMCHAICQVQQKLLQEVENLGIAIECNPTSNFKIGEIDRYDHHPITKFNTIDRQSQYPRHDISVSINTDDKGVFSTSIEREYALVAHALIRKYRYKSGEIKDSDVYDWLDKIRLYSIEQRFDKTVHLQDPTEKHTLRDLKHQIRQEVEDDIRGQRFVDRLKLSVGLLFGKKDDSTL
ncbi:hypothetical protein [Prevotella sp. P6B4]|uniref:hypothetical protein n=1 Tax=Prevotella sp. P6B4 TaxID=1410614 RepID=UPI00048B574F|nr:hypothetical protein [Prevotella sp. P6B4]